MFLPQPSPASAAHDTNRLLAALEPEDLALLAPHLELVNLPLKQVLYETRDTITHAYFPHDAIISLVNVMEDGHTVEIGVFGREGVIGLLSALVTREAFGRYIVQMNCERFAAMHYSNCLKRERFLQSHHTPRRALTVSDRNSVS